MENKTEREASLPFLMFFRIPRKSFAILDEVNCMSFAMLSVGLILMGNNLEAAPRNFFRMANETCKTHTSSPALPKSGKNPPAACFAYYFGDSTEQPPIKRSFENAYQCALHSGESEPERSLILGLLYANGEHVKRDDKLALAFFCDLNNKHSHPDALSLAAAVLKRSDAHKEDRIDYCKHNSSFLVYCCSKGTCGDHNDSK
jgi:TPR repeat protein